MTVSYLLKKLPIQVKHSTFWVKINLSVPNIDPIKRAKWLANSTHDWKVMGSNLIQY